MDSIHVPVTISVCGHVKFHLLPAQPLMSRRVWLLLFLRGPIARRVLDALLPATSRRDVPGSSKKLISVCAAAHAGLGGD